MGVGGGGKEPPSESTDFCEVTVKSGAETGLVPGAGYPIFTKNKLSAPVLISLWPDIDVTP